MFIDTSSASLKSVSSKLQSYILASNIYLKRVRLNKDILFNNHFSSNSNMHKTLSYITQP